MDPKLLTSLVLGALVLWSIYRRVRRNFGRQALNTNRLYVRIALLTLVGALMLLTSAPQTELLGALVGGVAAGAVLSWYGLRHTTFETTPEGRFYTPHTCIGLVVTGLFLGRLFYRFLSVYQSAQAAVPQDQNPFAAYQKSPLTLAIFGLLVGYYLVFSVGVLRKARELASGTQVP